MMLTKKDVAKQCQVSINTIDRWMKQGLPYVKVNRAVRFNEESVRNWIKRKEQENA